MTATPKPRANPALRLMLLRRIHSWLGLFIAPSVLFFAVTGAYQLYGLHESGPGYKPAPLAEKLGRVHMKQVFEAKPVRAAAPARPEAGPAKAAPAPAKAKPTELSVLLLRAVFLVVAIGLVVSTLIGVWMAQAHGRDKTLGWILLAAGAVLPVLILAL